MHVVLTPPHLGVLSELRTAMERLTGKFPSVPYLFSMFTSFLTALADLPSNIQKKAAKARTMSVRWNTMTGVFLSEVKDP